MARSPRNWYLLLLLFLSACGAPSSLEMCTSFTRLQVKIGETFTADEFLSWIEHQYNLGQIEEVEVRGSMQTPAGLYLVWEANEYEYSARLQEEILTQIAISRTSRKLQTQDIITCFGTPEYYRAVHTLEINGSNAQYFDLFFPSAGVVAHGYRNYRSSDYATLPVEERFPVLDFSVLEPGTLEEILERTYGTMAPFEDGAIRTWPSSWDDIVIDVTPVIQRLQNLP